MTAPDLVRFIEAQAEIRDRVVRELTAGDKQSHWMWFVFPQLAGLGHSATAARYAIDDLAQARRYLADPLLGPRLRHDVRLMLAHRDRTARQILGYPDDLKFRSCLTLFRAAASDESDRTLLGAGLERFYGGEPDHRTLSLLRGGKP